MRFFLIWYQCLQENASEECHQMFLNLVPGLRDDTVADFNTLISENAASWADSEFFSALIGNCLSGIVYLLKLLQY